VSTRRELLLLLRTRPASTARELADALGFTAVAIRRHLDNLVAEGLVEPAAPSPSTAVGVGRPPARWRLSSTGVELFPRHYDGFALDLLEDLNDEGGPQAVAAVFARRTDKLAAEYEAELHGLSTLAERMGKVAELRDDAGYVAECCPGLDGEVLLVEKNCAVHRIAEQHDVVCTMELDLIRRVAGPENEVTRISHTMSGDPVCCYRVRPRPPEDGSPS
jgi:predicted ArsR family transcriptional regulator